MIPMSHINTGMNGKNDDHDEGIVHGHIHNYNNMTYIHGHVHHTKSEMSLEQPPPTIAMGSTSLPSKISTAVPAPVPEVATTELAPTAHTYSNLDGSCKNFTDCQHFEYVNYHKSEGLRDITSSIANVFTINNATETAAVGNGFNTNLPFGNTFNDDLMLLPSKKQKISQPVIDHDEEIADCECNSRVLEICCDMEHGTNPSANDNPPSNENLKKAAQAPTAIDNKDMIIYADVKNDSFIQPAADTSRNVHSNLNRLPEINCDLTCEPNYEAENESYSDEEEEDIFEKFCKECLNLGHEKKEEHNCLTSNDNNNDYEHHHHHHHDHHLHHMHANHSQRAAQDSFDTPLSTTSTSSNERQQTSSHTEKHINEANSPTTLPNIASATLAPTTSCHDHVVNSQMDLKILDDLCNISSLYDLPFANHMNHHNHKNEHLGNVPKASQCFELPESSQKRSSTNTDNHNHHHHRVQLHPHAKRIPVLQSNDTTRYNKDLILGSQVNDKHCSYERSTIAMNWPQPAASTFHHHNSNSANNNNRETDTNAINFNWTFKNEKNALKCKWDQCSESFSSLIELQKHVLKDHVREEVTSDLTCNWNDCEFKGEDTCSLIKHINADHGINFGMKLLDPVSLLEQREQHHLVHFPGTQPPPQPQPEISKLACQWADCEEIFDSALDLTTHLEQFHLTRGRSEYQCCWKGCSRKFTQRQKLVRHLKVHSGYKPYKCQVCSKCFSSEDTLTQHMRIHSGEKPFECHICGKKFAVSSSLKIHIRTHTGEKPLQCKTCGKRFNESSNLSKHMKTHQKKYKCVFCARSFDNMAKFNAHELKCVKFKKE